VATAVHDIDVSGDTTEALDLGELMVKMRPTLVVGETAPAFEVKTLDGGTVRLEDSRGKVVLVNFWATWCSASVAGIPTLKGVCEEFGGDERFEMVSLSLDRSAETLQRFVEQRDMTWIQGHLGDWSQTELPSQDSISYIPTVLVIGPDGTVVARNLRGPQIREEVQKALAAL
jgi:peroxiredoxin